MLFHNGVLSPQFLSDSRVRMALTSAVESAEGLVKPGDLLAGALRSGGECLLPVWSRLLRPGETLERVAAALSRPGSRAGKLSSPPWPRNKFSPLAQQALDRFGAILLGGMGLLDHAALEIFLVCAIQHLDAEERQRLSNSVDVAQAVALLQENLEKAHMVSAAVPGLASGNRPEGRFDFNRQDVPFLLPPQLAPSEDLTVRARGSYMPAALPYDGEPMFDRLFDSLARALHRRRPNHVLLTGERGVGKSTLIAEFARRVASGMISFLMNKRILAVDCRYIPADESKGRLAAILGYVVNYPELIVFLDGFAALLRNERGASNKALLLSILSSARCQLICSITPREFEEHVSDDSDIPDFFTRIDVEEPEAEVAHKILKHFAAGLEHKYHVVIETAAVHQAVVLSANYILNDQLPAKALRILHQVCGDIDYERQQLGSTRNHIVPDDIVKVVAGTTGVPEETLRGIADKSNYEQSLAESIFGQDQAVKEVATELGLIKAGMTDPTKPASVMLFLGQTGTGKTEMAKVLARFYSTTKRLKTYTLGNCVEPHSVATIIGVPPGYVGNDKGGRLVNELNADPYCVFLLDEVDKAHPDVLQPFLNLFDEGWVSDQRGVRGYANKSIFILTTNVGQRLIGEMVKGGKTREEMAARMKEALSQIRHSKSDRPVFTPEFLARIKRLIFFDSLQQNAMEGITRKLLREIQLVWNSKRGKTLDVGENLLMHIALQSHKMNQASSGKEGGRIVRKLISEWVEAELQKAVSSSPSTYRSSTGIQIDLVPDQIDQTGSSQVEPKTVLKFI